MASRYTLDNLRTALGRPQLFLWECHRLLSTPIHRLGTHVFRRRHGDGIDVMDRDWDTLVILDACRSDYFTAQNTIDGTFETVISKGSNSWPFMQGNFVGKQHHDTVYVTANPHARKLDDDEFYTIETVLDRWDDEVGTVQPEDVVAAAIEAHEANPNKRLIVHFIQPHRPYIGQTAERLRERVDLHGYNRVRGLDDESDDRTGMSMWDAVKSGRVTTAELRQAYAESLDITLDHVSELLDAIDGKTVITADHGEMLGDRAFVFTNRLYGHPGEIRCRQLREVPWLTVTGDERRSITADAPVEGDRLADDLVEDRLRALGYRE